MFCFQVQTIRIVKIGYTACKLNPDSEVGNTFIFNVRMILCHVTRPHTPPVYSSHKSKSVANLTLRIEFTYGMLLYSIYLLYLICVQVSNSLSNTHN